MGQSAERRVGRPTVVPGEPSIQLGLTIEVSLYRAYRQLAQERREEVPIVLREALREYLEEKLTPVNSPG